MGKTKVHTITQTQNIQTNKSVSKQLKYYYLHKQERLDYQKRYYIKHKQFILTNNKQRYQSNKVKRIYKPISLLWDIRNRTYVLLFPRTHTTAYERSLFLNCFWHMHGKPRGERLYNKTKKGKIDFHFIPELSFYLEGNFIPKVTVFCNYPKNKQLVTARQLSIQTAHFLGLKAGDSIAWKEHHIYTGRIETHIINFDGSGLDLSHLNYKQNDLARLVEMRIETGKKGLDLLTSFAFKYSVNNYLRVWRGNQILVTNNPESAWRDYQKHFPLCKC